MTSNVPVVGWRATLQRYIPARLRETGYRVASGAVMFLFAVGVLGADQAAAWTQLGLSTVALVFALIYATTPWRIALYAVIGALGGVLMVYGIVNDVRWALITAAVAQTFGIATAAAKTITVEPLAVSARQA